MNKSNVDTKDPTFLVDINEATLAVKENRFAEALKILEINLSRYPDHIDSLYLAAVSSRYLKKFETFNIKNSERLYDNSLCVPSNDTLSNKDIDKISKYIKTFYENIISYK